MCVCVLYVTALSADVIVGSDISTRVLLPQVERIDHYDLQVPTLVSFSVRFPLELFTKIHWNNLETLFTGVLISYSSLPFGASGLIGLDRVSVCLGDGGRVGPVGGQVALDRVAGRVAVGRTATKSVSGRASIGRWTAVGVHTGAVQTVHPCTTLAGQTVRHVEKVSGWLLIGFGSVGSG